MKTMLNHFFHIDDEQKIDMKIVNLKNEKQYNEVSAITVKLMELLLEALLGLLQDNHLLQGYHPEKSTLMFLSLAEVKLQLLPDVLDVRIAQHFVLIHVFLSFHQVAHCLLKMRLGDQSYCQVHEAEGIEGLYCEGTTVVLNRSGVVMGQAVYVSQGVVRAVIIGVDADALLEPMDGLGGIILVVVCNSKAVMGEIVCWVDRDTLFVPLNRLIQLSQLVVYTSKSVIRVLILPAHPYALLIGSNCLLVPLLVIQSVSQSIVGACIVRFDLNQFLQLLHPLHHVFPAQSSYKKCIEVPMLLFECQFSPFCGFLISVPLQAVDEGQFQEGLGVIWPHQVHLFIQLFRLNKLLLVVLQVRQSQPQLIALLFLKHSQVPLPPIGHMITH